MEDVNMKKVLTVLMLVPLLVGCSKELEIHDSISEEDQVVYHPLPIAKYKDGYYIQDLNNNTLYYMEENKMLGTGENRQKVSSENRHF